MLTLDEIKDLILFCKNHRVSKVKVGEVSMEMSILAFTDEIANSVPDKESNLNTSQNLIDTDEAQTETDEDLYWSVNK